MDSSNSPPPLGLAMEWVGRIFAVTLEMILPGLGLKWLASGALAGHWWSDYLPLVGFVLGISLAIWHLLIMTGAAAERDRQRRAERQAVKRDDKA